MSYVDVERHQKLKAVVEELTIYFNDLHNEGRLEKYSVHEHDIKALAKILLRKIEQVEAVWLEAWYDTQSDNGEKVPF